MTSRFASPFDELLDAGRRQFNALDGEALDRNRPVAAVTAGAPADASGIESSARANTLVAGTASGIPFRLRVR